VDVTEVKVGFIGAGNMASALMRGLLRAGSAPAQLVATDVDAAKLEALRNELGIVVEPTIAGLVAACGVVVLAVKPKVVLEVLGECSPGGRLWISVAAGITTAQIEAALDGEARVVRAMPNTPALVGEGATGLCAGRHLLPGDLELAQRLFLSAGTTVVVEEHLLDAVTGLSGSGPAYVLLMIEALAEGGVRAGLTREVALQLATQTVRGTATLLQQTKQHPAQLKDMVTSPGGTTARGVQVLEQRGVRGALLDAVVAATERSAELRKG